MGEMSTDEMANRLAGAIVEMKEAIMIIRNTPKDAPEDPRVKELLTSADEKMRAVRKTLYKEE